jgi:hypothetical protein
MSGQRVDRDAEAASGLRRLAPRPGRLRFRTSVPPLRSGPPSGNVSHRLHARLRSGHPGRSPSPPPSLFFEQDADEGTAHLEARLARVEDKLDRLLEELSAGPDAGGAGRAVRK